MNKNEENLLLADCLVRNTKGCLFNITLCTYLCIGYAASLLLHGLISGCGERGLLSSCSAHAPHFNGFSLLSTGGLSGARALVVAGQGISSCSF